MKFSFRVTLLTILLGLTISLVAVLGVGIYFNTRDNTWDLTGQVMEQTSHRINDRVQAVLNSADRQARLARQLLESGRFKGHELKQLAFFLIEALRVRP